MASEDIELQLQNLIENRIPSSRRAIKDSYSNLSGLAAYCEKSYVENPDKRAAFEESKQYAIQSLSSVAYQIHDLATNVLQMLDIQTEQMGRMESDLNHIGQVCHNHTHATLCFIFNRDRSYRAYATTRKTFRDAKSAA